MSLPLILAIASGLLLLVLGAISVFQVLVTDKKRKGSVSRRLVVDDNVQQSKTSSQDSKDLARKREEQQSKSAEQALALATRGDVEKVARIRRMLIRAGDFDPASVARFALKRFAFMGTGLVAGILFCVLMNISLLTPKGMLVFGGLTGFGYFLPSFLLIKKTKERASEYRNGFPDFMDLMIVCADAGLSLDASIDRVSRELATTYPYLAHNLTVFSLELRAGRTINEAMKSFGDRVGLDEVDAFAVLLKQSKELGTSLASTLRVFSEEMREKRMSAAEEKAHALPAKMTIPVTMCILPTVVMIAIIPIIVTLGGE